MTKLYKFVIVFSLVLASSLLAKEVTKRATISVNAAPVKTSSPSVNTQRQPATQADLDAFTADLNKDLPTMLDSESQLLSVNSEQGLLFYNVVFVNYLSENLHPDLISASKMQQLKLKECDNQFVQRGVSMYTTYYDKVGNSVFRVSVTPAECGYS